MSRYTSLGYHRSLPGKPEIAMPFHWKGDQTGELPKAVVAYFKAAVGEGEVSHEQFQLVVEFAQYFINAPCWDQNEFMDDAGLAKLAEIRERSKSLASVESIRRWTEECMEMGIDPW